MDAFGAKERKTWYRIKLGIGLKNESNIWNIPTEDSFYLLERWKNLNYSKFLDLGCGLGRHSIQFAKAGFVVSSIDLSETAIERLRINAKENCVVVNAISGDMANLPYKDESFDCLLAYHVISHTDTSGIKQIIGEIKRVVKKGGEIYITLCSKNAWSYKDAEFPIVDENTVIKIEDGPRKRNTAFLCRYRNNKRNSERNRNNKPKTYSRYYCKQK